MDIYYGNAMHLETYSLLRHKYFNPMDYINGLARKGRKWERPWSTSTHFIRQFKNAFLSRNLNQNMPL